MSAEIIRFRTKPTLAIVEPPISIDLEDMARRLLDEPRRLPTPANTDGPEAA